MSKMKLPIIAVVLVIAAAGAGLFFTGIIGGDKEEGPAKKYVVPSVPLAETFTVNTADRNSDGYLLVGIALQLEPMDEAHWLNYSGAGGGGHGGGGDVMPGAAKVSVYPKFYDAVINTAATFRASELRTKDGKARFKRVLLERFHEIAEVDEAAHKAAPEDPTHLGVDPPYHVMNVDLIKFAVQER